MTRLVGRIAFGQIGPRSPGAQDPQDAVQHGARVLPRPAPPPAPTLPAWQQRPHHGPLLVRQIHCARPPGGGCSIYARPGGPRQYL